MYLYETHLHAQPVSACAHVSIRENLEFYKEKGYTGVFMTDHFADGNFKHDARTLSYEERIRFYFSAVKEDREIGPQKHLYVPASLLKKGKNEVVVFESDGIKGAPEIEFFDYPSIG